MTGMELAGNYQEVVKDVLTFLSSAIVLLTFFPLIRTDYWTFRVLEYPRFQKLLVCIATLVLWAVIWPRMEGYQWAIVGLLGVSVSYLFYKVIPYTRLYPREMARIKPGDKDNAISIFSANVYQHNDDYETMLRQILECDPDIVFLLETDKAWGKAMKLLRRRYPHYLEQPQDNTYGLLFYSRLPFHEADIKFLVKDNIPSVEAVVLLPSGQKVKIYGLHPEPPAPQEALTTTAKDKELMKVAFKAAKCKQPVIVAGDLNDVAWSYTTELFRKTSRLLDPRRGRGFYSTFSAKSWFMRFPLDYIFCSDCFGLIEMKRMPFNGSDHFAMFVRLQYDKSLGKTQEAEKPDEQELDDAQDKAAA